MTGANKVAQAWARQEGHGLRAGNIWFSGHDYYSYYTRVAVLYPTQGAAAVTTIQYSSSTSAHISAALNALRGMGLGVYRVPNIKIFEDASHGENLKHLAEVVAITTVTLDRCRPTSRARCEQQVKEAHTELDRYLRLSLPPAFPSRTGLRNLEIA